MVVNWWIVGFFCDVNTPEDSLQFDTVCCGTMLHITKVHYD